MESIGHFDIAVEQDLFLSRVKVESAHESQALGRPRFTDVIEEDLVGPDVEQAVESGPLNDATTLIVHEPHADSGRFTSHPCLEKLPSELREMEQHPFVAVKLEEGEGGEGTGGQLATEEDGVIQGQEVIEGQGVYSPQVSGCLVGVDMDNVPMSSITDADVNSTSITAEATMNNVDNTHYTYAGVKAEPYIDPYRQTESTLACDEREAEDCDEMTNAVELTSDTFVGVLQPVEQVIVDALEAKGEPSDDAEQWLSATESSHADESIAVDPLLLPAPRCKMEEELVSDELLPVPQCKMEEEFDAAMLPLQFVAVAMEKSSRKRTSSAFDSSALLKLRSRDPLTIPVQREAEQDRARTKELHSRKLRSKNKLSNLKQSKVPSVVRERTESKPNSRSLRSRERKPNSLNAGLHSLDKLTTAKQRKVQFAEQPESEPNSRKVGLHSKDKLTTAKQRKVQLASHEQPEIEPNSRKMLPKSKLSNLKQRKVPSAVREETEIKPISRKLSSKESKPSSLKEHSKDELETRQQLTVPDELHEINLNSLKLRLKNKLSTPKQHKVPNELPEINLNSWKLRLKSKLSTTEQRNVPSVIREQTENELISQELSSKESELNSLKVHSKDELKTLEHRKVPLANRRHYICDECGEVSFKRALFAKHVLSHTFKASRVFACNIATCDKSFTTQRSLKRHQGMHSGANPSPSHVCLECGREFTTQTRLKYHLFSHSVESKALVCPVATCLKQFTSKWGLHMHKTVHSDDKPFVCHICGYRSKWREFFKQHVQGHSAFDDWKFKCDDCGKMYATKSAIASHLKSHSGRVFACDEAGCGKRYKYKRELKVHKAKHADARPFACDECDYRAKTASLLRSHAARHVKGDGTVALCEKCGEAFTCQYSLRRHMLSHNENLQYACDEAGCGRRFKTAQGLKGHKLKHSDVKPFGCEKCEYRCWKLIDLRLHVVDHAPVLREMLHCGRCGTRFGSKGELDVHAKLYAGKCGGVVPVPLPLPQLQPIASVPT